ncbi:MAG: hypothetical protein AMXMBFR13_51220 [Phycisphaerae bacterium]
MIDRATVVGVIATLGLIVWVAAAGAGTSLGVFWKTPSVALVVGGAVLSALTAFPAGQFRSLGGVLRNALWVRTARPEESIGTLVRLAHVARRDGLLALDAPVAALEDGFLKRALQLAIDGTDARTIERVCRAELEGIDLRHACGAGLLETMGRAAPVFGMLGTLVGLVIMLGRMDDPSMIGPGMAVALLTTLYGLVVANVFCLPLARKLTLRSSEELLCKTIALEGVLALQAGDNPRIVERKLRAYLPASAQVAPSMPRLDLQPQVPSTGWLLRRLAVRRALGRTRPNQPAPPARRPGRERPTSKAGPLNPGLTIFDVPAGAGASGKTQKNSGRNVAEVA